MTTKITDHEDRAVERLPQQFRDKDVMEALMRVLIRPFQEIEDAFWQLFTERFVSTATGETLDRLGIIVGQPRGGMDDDDYRRHIYARIATNRSKGMISDILTIARLVIDDEDADLTILNMGAAALVLQVTGIVLDDDVATIAIGFLALAVKGGVRIILEYLTAIEDETFTLARATFLDGALAGGETSIDVVSTAGFTATGSLDIDVGLADEETVTYSGKTSTQFTGVSAVANPHADGAAIQQADGPGLGWGDSSAPLDGGQFSSAIEVPA